MPNPYEKPHPLGDWLRNFDGGDFTKDFNLYLMGQGFTPRTMMTKSQFDNLWNDFLHPTLSGKELYEKSNRIIATLLIVIPIVMFLIGLALLYSAFAN